MRARRVIRGCLCFVAIAFTMPGYAGVEEDWNAIVVLEAGPKGSFQTRELARQVTIEHLGRQEKALRHFLATYPDDARCFDARLQLAHLLAIRRDVEANPKAWAEATSLLDDLEKTAPPEKKADVAFARISLFMRRMRADDASARNSLTDMVTAFQKAFPRDRRLAPLLVELATVYDADPAKKTGLLKEAQPLATDEELKQRIDDDLKRVAMLGKPLELKFTPVRGSPFDAREQRGKIVLIVFFADWSPPSMETLRQVQQGVKLLSPEKFQPVGISLDENREALAANLKSQGLAWPVYCDGKGWESPLVRSFGINSLPTVWLLDRQGNLRTLNARNDAAAMARKLMQEH